MDMQAGRDNDHNACRRVRELYRYFRPEQAPSYPRVLNHADSSISLREELPPSVLSTLSTSPPALDPPQFPSTISAILPPEALTLGHANATLNSYAQLAALRLNVQRVLISVSDRESQFILSEATQTSDINDDSKKHAIATDGVWTGCSTIDHTWSICEATVALPPSSRKPGQSRFLIVNDLSKDERFKSLPFVQGDPNFRFYAGTPLTTVTNINIGCFFVLDDRPRDGLTAVEKGIMSSLSMLIMDYLKISREATEGRRAARVSRGLSYFVDGSSSFVESSHPSSYGSNTSSPPLSSSHLRPNPSAESLNSGGEIDARSVSSVSDLKADQPGASSGPDTPLPTWLSGSQRKGLSLEESHGNSWSFRRAANLLRESLELGGEGGVIFLEAGNGPVSDLDSGTSGASGSDCSAEGGNPAPVLAISTTEEPFAPEPGSRVLYPAANLDRGFLQKLLRRYSKGRLWSFHRDGMLSSSDDESARSPTEGNAGPTDIPRGNKKWKATENSMLNLYFPNASQIMFVPLWNAASSQWYAGCFCWNTVETHVMCPSVELSSVMGFASSIMAECSRVESLISDRQKGDFIGSISHELRSPLHGILAAAEFMDGTNINEFQGSLLETINACGRTLLDTMNQVLDFSKIVSLERTWRQLKRNKGSSLELKGMQKVNPTHLDNFVATDLAILTEEVIEGVCLGHSYGQRSTAAVDRPALLSRPQSDTQNETSPRPDVEVAMDIAQNDWVYLTQPGALRRIVMNLFGNAMKYTDSGKVCVRLEVNGAPEPRKRRNDMDELVTLTVSDTGKGISEEFLRGRLYTPFAQEDTLAVGTGLGLSIVRSLVKALNGTINIHSRPGQGTVVKVAIPLVRPAKEQSPEDSPVLFPQSPQQSIKKEIASPTRLLRDAYSGKKAGILGVDPAGPRTQSRWNNIARYLTEWYGLELVLWSPGTPVDILLADELALSTELRTESPLTAPPPSLLIVCNNSVDYNAAQAEWASLTGFVEIIRRPCGPCKLARSIHKCLDNSQAGHTQQNEQPIHVPIRPQPTPLPMPSCETHSLSMSSQNISEYTDDTTSDLTPQSTSSCDGYAGSMGSSSNITSDQEPLTPPLKESPPPSIDSTLTAAMPDNRGPRVLVVDDNSINLNLMLTLMKKRKLVTLDSADNGQLAVDAVENMPQGYDIIFMDMSMPVMNGFEATRAIRAIEKERDGCIPATIIALTGLSSPRDEADALASGVDLFLTKPVSFKEVSRFLDEWEGNGEKAPTAVSVDAIDSVLVEPPCA